MVGEDMGFRTDGKERILSASSAILGEACEFLETECCGGDTFMVQARFQNAVERIRGLIDIEFQRREDFDVLTGIYNKTAFFRKTEEIVSGHPRREFVFLRMDIGRFQLINTFFGAAEGDRLLCHVSGLLQRLASGNPLISFGRIEADIFCVCMPYNGDRDVLEFIKKMRDAFENYELEFDIVPTVGIYVVEDHTLAAGVMYDRANLAAKQCKGNYVQNYAFYNTKMSEELVREQKIVNDMRKALENEEFILFLQPKYDLKNNAIDGAEVLARWRSSKRGMISPGEFVPVFERNGFITNLDFYIWEKSCQLLSRWLAEGRDPMPLSVNISRVSLLHPKLVEIVCSLVDRYGIPPRLLQFELTESAYTSNPGVIQTTLEGFQKKGFHILMDDFGSGYSSLNVLKDLVVDVLKIDMKFLSDTNHQGRSENILASVIRMAKWLNMPVVAEGVERREQVEFLKSIGCEYVQGFYYARPMPVEDFERLAFARPHGHDGARREYKVDIDNLWTSTAQMEMLFSNMLQAVAIYEYEDGKPDVIRVNDAYYDIFGYDDISDTDNGVLASIDRRGREVLLAAFERVADTKEMTECEFQRKLESGRCVWTQLKLKYIEHVGNKYLILGSFLDITEHKHLDRELQKYRTALLTAKSHLRTVLVVDDLSENRVTLRRILEKKYQVIEAENGKDALWTLRNRPNVVDLVLLDLDMPVMDGVTFLRERSCDPILQEIPVITIMENETVACQEQAVELGADDYIGKPFIPEIAVRRVFNVMESKKQVGQVLQGYGMALEKLQQDELTGLYNRNTAEKLMQNILDYTEGMQVVMLVNVKNVYEITERYGLKVGEEMLCVFADSLKNCFRKSDILACYDRETFLIFMVNTPSVDFLEARCLALLEEVRQLGEQGIRLECAVGAAVSGPDDQDLAQLIQSAGEALKEAGQKGGSWFAVHERQREYKPALMSAE